MKILTIVLLTLFASAASANTITISTSASSGSGWSYSAGVITASANVTINNASISAYLVSGNLTVIAATDVIINGDINPALGTGIIRTLTFRASGNVVVEATRTISCSTGGLNIVLWSDADKSNGGYVFCKSTSVLNSKGAHIWMGGGDGTATWNGLTVGDGLARGSSTNVITSAELNSGANSSGFRNGITFYNNSIISAGGNIALNGQGAALSNAYGYMGIYMAYNATVSSGSGNIDIDARADGASSVIAAGWFYGILMIPTNNTNNGYGTVSIESTSGNITINGSARHNQNVNHNAGVAMFTQSATATARVMSQSGSIDITGSNLNLSNPSYAGIFLTGAGNENIVSGTGNITLRGNSSNSSVPGILANSASRIGYDGTNPYSGNIRLVADNISFTSTAAALQSTGNLLITPATASQPINIAATGGLALPASFFINNCINGFDSIKVGNSIYTGNVSIGTVTFQDNIVMETSGLVTQTGAITAIGQHLAFMGNSSSYTLNNPGNTAQSINAQAGTLHYVNSTALQLGTITMTGPLRIETLAGDLTVTGTIHTDHTGTDAIRLYADAGKAAGDATGGNIIVTSSPSVTTGIGGRASFYSGSEAGSTGLVSLVGGNVNVRRETDALTTTFLPVLGSGLYALLREENTVLPVGLIYFERQCENQKTVLRWTTATEEHNNGFYVERSTDLEQWETVSFIKGAGNNPSVLHYTWSSPGPVPDGTYYRLKQVDIDGKYSYSKIVKGGCATSGNDRATVQAYPNPTTGPVRLKGLSILEPTRYFVYNLQGRLVRAGTLRGETGTIDLVSQKSGVYLVRLANTDSDKQMVVIKE